MKRKSIEVFGLKFLIAQKVLDNSILEFIEKILIKIKNVELSNEQLDYINKFNNTIVFNEKGFTNNPVIDEILNKIFIKKECDDDILKIINGDNFIGVCLLGSDTKGKGILYGESNPNSSGDIDLIFIYKGDYEKENLKLLNKYICNKIGRKECKTYFYGNKNVHFNIDNLDNYVNNKNILMVSRVFENIYGNKKRVDSIRSKISKFILETFDYDDLDKLDLYYKYHLFPFIEKDFKKFPRSISILKNLVFNQNHYLFMKTLIDGLSNYHIRDTLEYYKNLDIKKVESD